MYKFDRRNLAELWAKAQEKSGERQPHLDERCASAELHDLYSILEACEIYDTLPKNVRAAINRYKESKVNFEKSWGEEIEEREEKTCPICRRFKKFIGIDGDKELYLCDYCQSPGKKR